MSTSPYYRKSVNEWKEITKNLIDEHPLETTFIVKTVLDSWESILEAEIDAYPIGNDMKPKPQVMGFFLHELISRKIQDTYPKSWRIEKDAHDKDIVCLDDSRFSIEIKTSSSTNQIFGNRSYSQETSSNKKSKSGYYLAINFEKFAQNKNPEITMIRFGWIDHEDWMGQKAASGQQARLSPDVEKNKLLPIYSRES